MEYLSESERYENGGLAHDCEAALAVAAMQILRLTNMDTEPETST